MKRKIECERGSGNVFADIGVPNPEQALAKAEIARHINKLIAERGLTQTEARTFSALINRGSQR